MTDKFKKATTAFVLICLLSAFLGWCSGYNFDYRSAVVAFWVYETLVIAGGAFVLLQID
jgi:hypothetical protein